MPSSSTEPVVRRAPLWLNLALSALVLLLLLLLLEGFSSLLMSVRAARHTMFMREVSHTRHDAELGWAHQPNAQVPDQYGPGLGITINAQGFRATEDYARAVPAGRYRLVALGDSFTMGYGVADADPYPAQMQAACPNLQTVNMGQGGYGLDQDYLWYKRDGVALESQVLLVALIAHDFYRMVSNKYVGYPKPTLAVEGQALVVKDVPVPISWMSNNSVRKALTFVQSLAIYRLIRSVAWHVAPPAEVAFYGDISPNVMAAAGKALDDLAALSKARGQQMVLVYLPVVDLLPQEPSPEAAWMQAYAQQAKLPFINLVPTFSRLAPAQLASLFLVDKHYSAKGNQRVAQALLRALSEKVPGFPACPIGQAP